MQSNSSGKRSLSPRSRDQKKSEVSRLDEPVCRRSCGEGRRDVRNKALMILCLSLLAVPQPASGQSSAGGEGESEEDLSGTWLVTVHLTITNHGMSGLSQTDA